MRLNLLILSLFLIPFKAFAATTFFLLNTMIDPSVAEKFDEILSRDTEVALLIDSPGGLIFAAEDIAAHMRQNGKVKCYVNYAASAALQIIMPACSERYASATTVLKFHTAHAVLQNSYSAAELLEISIDLEKENQKMLSRLMKSLPTGVSKENISRHLYMETQLTADRLDTVDPSLKLWFTKIYAKDCYPLNLGANQACSSILPGVSP